MGRDPRRWLALAVHLLVLRPLLHLVFGLNIRGKDNLPDRGPCILAANHNSHLDILVIYAALPVRLVLSAHVVAALDYFAPHRLLFAVVDFLFKPVWVDRAAGGGDCLERMYARLDAGDSIVIFPEGTRGDAGCLGRFRGGVGKLAHEYPGVPLLPVLLHGTAKALPRQASLPVPIWQHVTIGPPQELVDRAGDTAQALRSSIEALERSAVASRHRRRPERHRSFVVAVLGIDGSGKSTLSRRLCLELSRDTGTCLIGDSLELFADGDTRAAQPLLKEKLRRWVSAQAKDAKSLARYKIPKLTELLLRDALLGEAKRWYGPDLVFMDGSPILNMTAWSVLYRPELMSEEFCARAITLLAGTGRTNDPLFKTFPELKFMKRLGLARLSLPDAVIFLDVPPEVSMARIRSRGEKMQVHETAEKLGRLREAYLLVTRSTGGELGLPTFVLDGDRDLDTIVDEARAAVAQACAAEGGSRK